MSALLLEEKDHSFFSFLSGGGVGIPNPHGLVQSSIHEPQSFAHLMRSCGVIWATPFHPISKTLFSY